MIVLSNHHASGTGVAWTKLFARHGLYGQERNGNLSELPLGRHDRHAGMQIRLLVHQGDHVQWPECALNLPRLYKGSWIFDPAHFGK